MEQLERQVARMVPDLPENHRRLAEYFVAHLDEVAFMSASELARRVGLSESTVVRFAQRLGYRGYQKLKEDTQRYIRNQITTSASLEHTLTDDTGLQNPFHQVLTETMEHLNESAKRTAPGKFSRAIELIVEADTVYLFGEGSAGTPVYELAFWLQRLRPGVTIIDAQGRNLFDKILHVTEKDLLISFAFRRNNPTVETLEDAFASRKAQSLLVTDLSGSTMAARASLVLDIVRGPVGRYRSMAVPVAVADALVLGVVRKLGSKAVGQMQLLDELRQRYGLV